MPQMKNVARTGAILPAHVCVSALGLATALVLLVPTLQAAGFEKGPYLIYDGVNTEMDVLWQATDDTSTCEIEWGPDTGYGNGPFVVSEYGDNQYSYQIGGLTPGVHYYYRINIDGNFEVGHFRAAPAINESSVTIWAYGDTRTYPATHNNILGTMLSDIAVDPIRRQTMVIHSGDLIGDGNDEQDWTNEFFPRNRPNIMQLQRELPLNVSRGNHEGNGTLLRKYFPHPYIDNPACYYNFDYGPIHVTVVDDQSLRSVGSPQYIWVENDLATSNACWKIVLFHEPAWSAGGGHSNDYRNQVLTANLFEVYGVDIVIAGHNHYYARALKEGIHHITGGGGGAPLYTPDPDYPYVVVTHKSYNYNRIDVDGDQLLFTAFDQNGSQIDSIVLNNNCAGAIFANGFESGDTSQW